ncbi:hypothetical protein CVS30_12595 [Arthrobacter psychrolactophilus]|uniref:Uncharacterized protein n=1 Tax=Arthrobacter psychrolactophilus TaxID=92442 RepID=A0A2V5IPT2_9MICC|nr:hypothetical protein CVS30_12595 [Arthrobacter psychrolactophilus]
MDVLPFLVQSSGQVMLNDGCVHALLAGQPYAAITWCLRSAICGDDGTRKSTNHQLVMITHPVATGRMEAKIAKENT